MIILERCFYKDVSSSKSCKKKLRKRAPKFSDMRLNSYGIDLRKKIFFEASKTAYCLKLLETKEIAFFSKRKIIY